MWREVPRKASNHKPQRELRHLSRKISERNRENESNRSGPRQSPLDPLAAQDSAHVRTVYCCFGWMEISVPKLSWRFLRLNRFALKKAVGVHVSKPGASLCVSVTFPSAKTAKQVLRSLAG